MSRARRDADARSRRKAGPVPKPARRGAAQPDRRKPRRRIGRAVRRVVLAAIAIVVAAHLVTVGRIAWLRGHEPGTTAFMEARRQEVHDADDKATPVEIDQRWVDLEQISPHLVRAAIAGEDYGFFEHAGLDLDAMSEAARANREAGEVVKGGSTITQQLAKNLFLSPRRSYIRKAREALMALELEALLGKRRIMELYLNVIEWGDGIYGAEAAAQHYFRRPAKSLTRSQAAHLAAMIPGPRKAMHPRHNPRRHRKAKQRILRAMRAVDLPKGLMRVQP